MDAALCAGRADLEDYYGLLGCDELSSSEQINNEYKIRALQCHPDKHPDDPRAVSDFQKLQQAREVLCDKEKRKHYDLWKRSGVSVSFHQWMALKDSVKTSMHWVVRAKKEPMLEGAGVEDGTAQAKQNHNMAQQQDDLQHFRWTSDRGSPLLRKFRNYEI